METPPQAWGRPTRHSQACQCLGNTPTGVGKTHIDCDHIDLLGKHPHRRGEDRICLSLILWPLETPPQAWGRHGIEVDQSRMVGNTPTGVGKTQNGVGILVLSEKHPHRRGEDRTISVTPDSGVETPPQAWGRPAHDEVRRIIMRNTPTGVGKTPLFLLHWVQ